MTITRVMFATGLYTLLENKHWFSLFVNLVALLPLGPIVDSCGHAMVIESMR